MLQYHQTSCEIADTNYKMYHNRVESEESIMKINNIGHSGLNPYKKNLNKQDEIKHSSFRGKDEIEISTTAKELQQTSHLVAQRETRVEEIRVSINNGTYALNAKDTARSILNFYKR